MENIIRMQSAEIVAAVEKVSLSGGKHIIFTLAKKNKQSGEKNFLILKSSDGSTQVETNILVSVEVEPAENITFVLPETFVTVVKAVARGGDEVTFEVNEKIVIVKNESAVVPVAVLESTKTKTVCIKNFTPKKHPCIFIEVENEVLRAAVNRVSLTCITSDNDSQFGNSIILVPFGTEEDAEIRFITSDKRGGMVTGVKMSVAVQSSPVPFFSKAISEDSVFCIPASFLIKAVRNFAGDTTNWYIFENQIVVSSGLDFYTMTLKSFNADLTTCKNFLFEETEIEYHIEMDAKDCVTALDIATVNKDGDNAKVVVMDVSEDGVVFTSFDQDNKAKVPDVSVKGTLCIGIRKDRLTRVLNGLDRKVTIEGLDAKYPLYVTDGLACAKTLFLPINLKKEEDSQE